MRHPVLALALTALLLPACRGREAPSPPTPAVTAPMAAAAAPAAPPAPISTKGTNPLPPSPAAEALGPEGPSTARSTSADIYLRNLEARRKAIEARLAARPDDASAVKQLAAWHQEKMQLDGDLQHAVEALKLLDHAIATADGAAVRRQRAGVRSHLHDFAGAEVDLRTALEREPGHVPTIHAVADAVRRQGRHAEAAMLQATPLKAPPGWEDHAREALRHFEEGRIDEADLALRRAHGAYRDVHPVTLAWLDFQRGHLRLRTGRLEEAGRFFRAAYQRLPAWYVAAEHLAEVEAALGRHDEALRIYDEVVQSTGLPEFIAARAGVLAAKGDAAGAEKGLAEAEAAWIRLLEKHGAAIAGHAIDFWLEDVPKPAVARQWAERNLERRRDPDALLLAARARAATGDLDGARALVQALRAAPPVRIDEHLEGLAEVLARLGDAAGADAALAEAKKLNPRVGAP